MAQPAFDQRRTNGPEESHPPVFMINDLDPVPSNHEKAGHCQTSDQFVSENYGVYYFASNQPQLKVLQPGLIS